MNEQLELLEGMLLIEEQHLDNLLEAYALAKWKDVDAKACMEKIKAMDAKFKELTPVKTASSLSDDEKVKLGRKFGLAKIGGAMISALLGAVGGAGAGAVGGGIAGKKHKANNKPAVITPQVKQLGYNATPQVKQIGYKEAMNFSNQAKRGGMIGAGAGAVAGGALGANSARKKYIETNCNGRLCYVSEGNGVKVSLVYRDKDGKIVVKTFSA